jgi:hypothetical protein
VIFDGILTQEICTIFSIQAHQSETCRKAEGIRPENIQAKGKGVHQTPIGTVCCGCQSKAKRRGRMTDLDGDGHTSPWEAQICKICLLAMLTLAIGKEALQGAL